eukprot:TRINITY_DN702_c0_g1_i1.p1 TRINITY_DN702_c0_g1~~TRINITY_DN702_c0_g1_i1.p1  ORF type:complete len:461 (-),score=148.32 TRINITY_DN702_c0_g1_i1:142-1524(-)
MKKYVKRMSLNDRFPKPSNDMMENQMKLHNEQIIELKQKRNKLLTIISSKKNDINKKEEQLKDITEKYLNKQKEIDELIEQKETIQKDIDIQTNMFGSVLRTFTEIDSTHPSFCEKLTNLITKLDNSLISDNLNPKQRKELSDKIRSLKKLSPLVDLNEKKFEIKQLLKEKTEELEKFNIKKGDLEQNDSILVLKELIEELSAIEINILKLYELKRKENEIFWDTMEKWQQNRFEASLKDLAEDHDRIVTKLKNSFQSKCDRDINYLVKEETRLSNPTFSNEQTESTKKALTYFKNILNGKTKQKKSIIEGFKENNIPFSDEIRLDSYYMDILFFYSIKIPQNKEELKDTCVILKQKLKDLFSSVEEEKNERIKRLASKKVEMGIKHQQMEEKVEFEMHEAEVDYSTERRKIIENYTHNIEEEKRKRSELTKVIDDEINQIHICFDESVQDCENIPTDKK